jgi:hypothetical protein
LITPYWVSSFEDLIIFMIKDLNGSKHPLHDLDNSLVFFSTSFYIDFCTVCLQDCAIFAINSNKDASFFYYAS